MKKKIQDDSCRATIAIPAQMRNEFRKLCVVQDLKPSAVAKRLFGNWIEAQKKNNIKT